MAQLAKPASLSGNSPPIQLHPRQIPHRVRTHRLRQLLRHRQSRWTHGHPRTLGYCRTGRVQQAAPPRLPQLRCLPHHLLGGRRLINRKCSQKSSYRFIQWYPELQENVGNVPKIFVGNKIDLREEYAVYKKDPKEAPIMR